MWGVGTETCADPESFVIGGPTLTFFFVVLFFLDEGVENQIHFFGGPHRPASETPLKWRFAGVRMMPQHGCWLGSFVIFQGIWTSSAKKPYIFVIFQGGGGSGPHAPPPLWIRACGTDNRGSIGDEFSAIVVFWLLLISAEQCNKLNYQYAVK